MPRAKPKAPHAVTTGAATGAMSPTTGATTGALSPTCVSVSPETDPHPSPDDTAPTAPTAPLAPTALSCIVASLTRIESTLGSMERALDAVRGVCAVNAELTAANVFMRASASANSAGGAAPTSGDNGANSAANGAVGSSRVVTYIVGAADVALVGNEHTFDMRSTLKAADAKWNSAPPARWVVPSAAWTEHRAAWETTFGVSFVERAS